MTKKHKRKDGPITGLDGIQKAKLRRDYTREELVKFGKVLYGMLDDIREAMDDFGFKMQVMQGNAINRAALLRQGYEMVEINVKAEFNAKTKLKKLYDLKTGELIREEAMQPEDFQVGLPGVIGPAVGKEGV